MIAKYRGEGKVTDFLIKRFVKNPEQVKENEVRENYAMLSTTTGIVVNLVLSIGKIIIGILSNSMSILSDGLNNITDAGSSVVTMIGFKMSQKKMDQDHPWGHGRMEYIAAFIVDLLIILVGIELFQSSIDKIIHPLTPNISEIAIVILVIAILAKLWLFVFYRKIAKKIDSSAIQATAYDSISDTVSTSVVLISTLVTKFTGYNIDGYVSILVAGFILFTGFKAVKEIVDLLLGTKPDPEFIREIEEFTKNYPEIIDIHDIMVHDYGPGRKILSFHAEVPANSNIEKAHDVIDQLESDLYKKFSAITTIHMDPIAIHDEEINQMREIAEKIVKEISPEASIHDFRITNGGERVNMIFDLLLPFELEKQAEEIEKKIKERIHQENEKYYAVIKVEYPYY